MQWSTYQQALFDFGTKSDRNGIVSAVAGSGKTASIEELCRRLPQTMAVRYLVFNKKNADEAQRRMPRNVEAGTFHSAGMRALRVPLGRPQVAADKVQDIIRGLHDEGILSDRWFMTIARPAAKLVGLAKNSGFGTKFGPGLDEVDAWLDLADHFGVEPNLGRNAAPQEYAEALDEMVALAQGVLWRNNQDTRRIDFDDMLYFVSLFDVPMQQFPMVCVDEAQDTNAIQRDMLRRMVGGRLIAVGDHRQAIYGFRGADAEAMQLIRDEFDCVELQLSINYRCSQTVVAAARAFCPQLEAHDGAPTGSVLALDALKLSELQPRDAVLCRTAAPLIELAMQLIGNGTPVKVMGRDIGAGLVALARKIANSHVRTVSEFEDALDQYEQAETARVSRRKNAEELLERLADRMMALRAFVSRLNAEAPVAEVVEGIEGLFTDNPDRPGVTLATVHKAKGLEWPRVYILNREAMPLPRRQDWEAAQEMNIVYVAYTRAQVDLRFIELDRIAA